MGNAESATNFCGLEMNDGRRLALEKLFGKISEVASFPATAQRILELTQDENSSADQIAELVQTDPALVANLLKRVNSSFYGLTQQVSEVRTAIALLGMREIRNMAMTILLGKFSDKNSDHGTYKRQSLWDHCVAVGTAARALAKQTGKASPEEAYVAGLLHDFGYILCDQFLHKHFCTVIDQLTPERSTPEIENQIFSFDHAMLGGFVARKWNFPDSVAHAITFHHKPDTYEGKHGALLAAVVIANHACSQAGQLSLGVNNALAPSEAVLSRLGLTAANLPELATQLQAAIATAQPTSAA